MEKLYKIKQADDNHSENIRIFNLLTGKMIKEHDNKGSEVRRRDDGGIVVNIKQKKVWNLNYGLYCESADRKQRFPIQVV